MVIHAEEWRPIPGFPAHYEASSLGRIRSLSRVSPHGHRLRGRVLRDCAKGNGYRYVTLGMGGKGKRQNAYVHRLVLLAFRGQPEAGNQACHCDGDRSNNALANLRWDTVAGNHADKGRHGTSAEGERNANAVLSEAQVVDLLIRARNGQSIRSAAKQVGVRYSHACRIVRGERWRHVKKYLETLPW